MKKPMKRFCVSLVKKKTQKEGVWRTKNLFPWIHDKGHTEVHWCTDDFDPCVPKEMIHDTFYYYGDIYWVFVYATDWIDAFKKGKPLIRSFVEYPYAWYQIRCREVELLNKIYELEQEVACLKEKIDMK